jgi:single-stranded DNA-binding protein
MQNQIELRLVGQLGRDPREVKIKSEKPCAAFPLACNVGKGENQRVHWYNVMIIGKSAQYVMDKVRKGDQIQIREGIPVPNSSTHEGEFIASITVFTNQIDFIRPKMS